MGFRALGLRAEGMGFRVCRLGSGSGVHYPARGLGTVGAYRSTMHMVSRFFVYLWYIMIHQKYLNMILTAWRLARTLDP